MRRDPRRGRRGPVVAAHGGGGAPPPAPPGIHRSGKNAAVRGNTSGLWWIAMMGMVTRVPLASRAPDGSCVSPVSCRRVPSAAVGKSRIVSFRASASCGVSDSGRGRDQRQLKR